MPTFGGDTAHSDRATVAHRFLRYFLHDHRHVRVHLVRVLLIVHHELQMVFAFGDVLHSNYAGLVVHLEFLRFLVVVIPSERLVRY